MKRQVIRSIRKGSVQWSEEDRLQLSTLLINCGYAVRINRQQVEGSGGKKNGQMEYTVEFWEVDDAVHEDRMG